MRRQELTCESKCVREQDSVNVLRDLVRSFGCGFNAEAVMEVLRGIFK